MRPWDGAMALFLESADPETREAMKSAPQPDVFVQRMQNVIDEEIGDDASDEARAIAFSVFFYHGRLR